MLKSLEGSVWDDASIDGLLAAADESGDGELQVEESIFLPSPAEPPFTIHGNPWMVKCDSFHSHGLFF